MTKKPFTILINVNIPFCKYSKMGKNYYGVRNHTSDITSILKLMCNIYTLQIKTITKHGF